MSNEEIEGNKLIAEFMGKSIYPMGGTKEYKKWKGELCDYNLFEIKYHTSWDWLMSVVEKIEEIDRGVFNFSVLYKQGLITSNTVDFTIKGYPKRYNISVTSLSTSCNCEYVRKHCVFNVIGVKDSAIEAALFESNLISKNVNNPKFLNINKASTYTQRNNKTKTK